MTETKQQMHDVIYCAIHAKKLADEKKIDDLKEYIKRFFFAFSTDYFFDDGNSIRLYDSTKGKKLLADDLCVYERKNCLFNARTYLESSEFRQFTYRPTINFQKPITFTETVSIKGFNVEQHFVNMARPIAIDVLKPIKLTKQRQTEVHKQLKLIYDHILNVWCSKQKDLNEYILNFFACTFGGRKLRKCIYSQTDFERCGRGTILNFIKEILGNAMHKTTSVEDIIKYTKCLEGRLFVNIDELPVDAGNFKAVNDALKGLITEKTFMCRDMFCTGYEQLNTFNTIITSNNSAILFTQNNNSRYVCTEIDESYRDNVSYFVALNKATADKDVQRLFYDEMMERFKTLGSWNEDVVPMTKTKKNKIIEALPPFVKYLKENYVLTNTDLNVKTSDFLDNYRSSTNDKSSKQQIGRYLSEFGIKPIKQTDQSYVYRKSCAEITAIFKQKNWMDDENDVVNEDKVVATDRKTVDQLQRENELLKQQLKDLAATKTPEKKIIKIVKSTKSTKKTEPVDEDEPEPELVKPPQKKKLAISSAVREKDKSLRIFLD